MTKPNAPTIGKTLQAAATTGAVINASIQLAGGHPNPLSLTLTLIAVILLGIVLADDTRTGLRAIRRHLSHKPGPRFRCTHGNPATWDNNEYEAYFALTADQTPTRRNIHHAA
ncbi:MAG TPA: hypothetical protein VIQ30_23555 [Pseudonocardia sp.]